jgi:hypothetical protein
MRWALVPLVLASSVGLSQADGDPFDTANPRDVRASRLFVEGRQLLADGNETAACDRFEQSLDAERAPGTAMNLAVCMEHRGYLGQALQLFEDAAARLRAADAVERAQFAQTRVDALVPRVATLTVRLTNAPDGVTIRIRDRRIAANSPTPITPGLVSIVARTPDGRESRAQVQAVVKGAYITTIPAFAPRVDDESDKPPKEAAIVGGAGILASIGLMVVAAGVELQSNSRDGYVPYYLVGALLSGLGVGAYFAAPREPPFVMPTVTSTSAGLSFSGRF